MPAGRPAIEFNQEIADYLCEQLSSTNKATSTILAELGKTADTVGVTTIYKWLRDNPEFAKDYERSKGEQADFLAEEIIEIADDSSLDIAFSDEGKPFVDKEHINRSRLRIDARKWIASKLKPKKYGDKITHAGDSDNPLVVQHKRELTEEELLAIAAKA